MYEKTSSLYGSCGRKSIDPVVFYKICLVGYLENIISDRQLISFCRLRLDILLFLGYDLDEELPWHSTISRTRQLYGEKIFLEAFQKVLGQCITSGMVSGNTQAIDSAFVKANASMDSFELKVLAESLEEHLHKIRHISEEDKHKPRRPAKENKAPKAQREVSASSAELLHIKNRNKKWSKDQNRKPGSGNPLSKYTSKQNALFSS